MRPLDDCNRTSPLDVKALCILNWSQTLSLTYDSACHNHVLRLHFYQPHVAHFDKSLLLLNHWWQVSQLEMHVSVCVTHRPLFLVTFHLSRYIGVRYLPPALSECGVLMSRES